MRIRGRDRVGQEESWPGGDGGIICIVVNIILYKNQGNACPDAVQFPGVLHLSLAKTRMPQTDTRATARLTGTRISTPRHLESPGIRDGPVDPLSGKGVAGSLFDGPLYPLKGTC